jgi:hypothetical protein
MLPAIELMNEVTKEAMRLGIPSSIHVRDALPPRR